MSTPYRPGQLPSRGNYSGAGARLGGRRPVRRFSEADMEQLRAAQATLEQAAQILGGSRGEDDSESYASAIAMLGQAQTALDRIKRPATATKTTTTTPRGPRR